MGSYGFNYGGKKKVCERSYRVGLGFKFLKELGSFVFFFLVKRRGRGLKGSMLHKYRIWIHCDHCTHTITTITEMHR